MSKPRTVSPGLWLSALAGGLLSLVSAAGAVEQGDMTTVNITGTLVETLPCVVNGSRPIVVDFGNELMTTRIDGITYKQPIIFTAECGENVTQLKLRIDGARADFDPTVLGGAFPGLGIALYHGDNRYQPGEWLTFTGPVMPELHAVPVKQDGISLSGGAFSVLAALVVDYQ